MKSIITIIIIKSNILGVNVDKSHVKIIVTKTINVFVNITTNTNSEVIIYN